MNLQMDGSQIDVNLVALETSYIGCVTGRQIDANVVVLETSVGFVCGSRRLVASEARPTYETSTLVSNINTVVHLCLSGPLELLLPTACSPVI